MSGGGHLSHIHNAVAAADGDSDASALCLSVSLIPWPRSILQSVRRQRFASVQKRN